MILIAVDVSKKGHKEKGYGNSISLSRRFWFLAHFRAVNCRTYNVVIRHFHGLCIKETAGQVFYLDRLFR